ncbi:ferredoxin [Streptomyces mobaraensis NBRC 13819 = DSM 40847]|uniref:Ferredoxin n=2 Tax=Streptomyces mobaraensis TaxID=35621 RepID=A0A5N5W243_STRMB|nr:ferredoxin [Streptomyces mobaraensis]EME98741.1 ferredoxin [Streptomyces mobaraensis NBRC 13819 = DSM 40847]KAB7836054.1 ferredoxin [Streptomyces mobaraensis]QTT75879.1 ferredoxin [Streptomyces mobaraensis NBRC 13819 = DSM 40847]
MRVSIDSDLCIGSGQCALTAPGVFDTDDDGFGVVRSEGEGGADPMVKEAVRACPVQAITLDED